jgi:arginase
MGKPLGVIGVPSSAGAFAPGQERAPRALRKAGLQATLVAAGLELHDEGDGPVCRWQPDRANPFAQNLETVVTVAQETAERVRAALAAGRLPLVIGGDCTIELGTVAGHLPSEERLGLLYLDLHPDLNLPAAPGPGALDWTGVAHLLAEAGSAEPLSGVGGRVPMLAPESIFLFAYGPEQATPREREAIGRLGLRGIPVDEVAHDPEGAAVAALAWIEPRCDRLLVHFDVDTVDFTDLPLSENTGRNQGLSFEATMRALRVFLGSERLSALTVTELNPDHGEADGATLHTFITALADCLGSATVLRR